MLLCDWSSDVCSSDLTKQYVGEWANGKRSGQGAEFDENGVPLHEGTFENGEFVG